MSERNGAAALRAQLWDLRANSESKLRCLTRVQQAIDKYRRSTDQAKREHLRSEILKDLQDIVSISTMLPVLARETLKEARLFFRAHP